MIKTPEVPETLLKAIEKYENFIIIGHKNPDGDCLNSQLALGRLLEKIGKTVHLVSPGPFDRHEITGYQDLFHLDIDDDTVSKKPLVIVVDCSTPDRIGSLIEQITGLEIAVVDHHSSGSEFGDYRYIVPKAFSVTFLIYELYKKMAVPIDEKTAEWLLFGLLTDTGFFRHIGPYRGEVFSMVEDLVEAGASLRELHQKIQGHRSFLSRKLLGELLSKTEQYFSGRVLLTWETREEILKYGEANRDSDALYNQLLGVEAVEAVVYIREEPIGNCTIGMRISAESHIDAGKFLALFGGGGHKKAAGATLFSTDLSTAKSIILDNLKDQL